MSSQTNKDRLHIALYARGGGPNTAHLGSTYHWALIIGPKTENKKSRGMRLHAHERLLTGGTAQWFFDEREISVTTTNMLMIRITIAKIRNMQRTLEIIRGVPVRPEVANWTCKSWVQEVIALLDADGSALGVNRVMEWGKVSGKAESYCEDKIAIRRFCSEGDWDAKYPPTFDFTQGVDGMEVRP